MSYEDQQVITKSQIDQELAGVEKFLEGSCVIFGSVYSQFLAARALGSDDAKKSKSAQIDEILGRLEIAHADWDTITQSKLE